MGHRLSVTVTASKAGKAPASSTSAETARVTAAKSQVVVGLSATSVKKKQLVTLTVTVSTTAGTPGGSVLVYENGHRVKTLTLSAGGTASAALTMNQRGLRTMKVVYAGEASVEGSSSQVHVRVL
ncbi:Ig-like domain repeat protein [Streptomyces sp. NPDC002346]